MSDKIRHVQARVDAESFRRLKIELARRGMTLNDMIQAAVADFLAERPEHGERLALDG